MVLGIGEDKGVTGTNEISNLFKMAAMIAVPAYVVVIFGFISFIVGLPKEFTFIIFGVGAVVWVTIIMMWWANATKAAALYYCWESAKVKYDEETEHTLDLKFYPEHIRKSEHPTPTGKDIYFIPFINGPYLYDHPTMGPITYDVAALIMPFAGVPFDQTFKFRNKETVWQNGMIAECPNCAQASFHVSPDWLEIDGEFIPVFKVADSTFHYAISKAQMLEIDKDTVIKIPSENDNGEPIIKEVRLSDFDSSISGRELLQAEVTMFHGDLTQLKLENTRLVEDRHRLLKNNSEIADDAVKEFLETDFKLMNNRPKLRTVRVNMKYIFLFGAAVLFSLTAIFVSIQIWG